MKLTKTKMKNGKNSAISFSSECVQNFQLSDTISMLELESQNRLLLFYKRRTVAYKNAGLYGVDFSFKLVLQFTVLRSKKRFSIPIANFPTPSAIYLHGNL